MCRTVFKSTDTKAPRLVASAVMGQLTTSVGYCGYCLSDAAAWTVLGVQEAAGLPLGAVCFSVALMAGARYTLRAMLHEAKLDPEEGMLHLRHHSLWGIKPVEVRVSGVCLHMARSGGQVAVLGRAHAGRRHSCRAQICSTSARPSDRRTLVLSSSPAGSSSAQSSI